MQNFRHTSVLSLYLRFALVTCRGLTTKGPSWGYSKVNFDRFFRQRGRFSPNVDKNVHERPPDTPTKGLLWLSFVSTTFRSTLCVVGGVKSYGQYRGPSVIRKAPPP